MITRLSPLIAERMINELASSGPEGCAWKALRRYRDFQTESNKAAALAAVNRLSKPVLAHLRAVARV